MFELSVRFLSGDSLRIVPKPDMTVAELQARVRAEIEKRQELPDLHDVKLFQGTQELLSGATIQVELQAVVTRSGDEALQQLKTNMSCHSWDDLTTLTTGQKETLSQENIQAVAILRDVAEREPAYCCRIWDLVLQAGSGPSLKDIPEECLYIQEELCAIVGCFCGEPTPYMKGEHGLLESLSLTGRTWAKGFRSAVVGREIAKRCGDSTPHALRKALLIWACENLKWWTLDKCFKLSCELLGMLGDKEYHIATLRVFSVEPFEAYRVEAIRLIDLRLKHALEKSELEALWREQEDLHRTILESKTECRPRCRKPEDSAGQPDGLVLLCFQSCRKELIQSLLESPMALQLAADGVVLQPGFADGRIILAKGVTEAAVGEARGPWHVAVRAADEGKVYDILRECLGRQRPRVKDGGRFPVAGDVSLFGDASSVSGTATECEDLDTFRTFLHAKLRPQAPARRTVSAPPRIS